MAPLRIVSLWEAALVAGLVALGVGAHHTNRWLEARSEEARESGDVGALPDGEVLRVASLGFDRVVADLFWIRTVYYMGDEISEKAGYPAAERLADLVTDIDPLFRTVYVVMATGLEGLAGDPAASERLLLKGIEHVSYWKLHFLLGFQYFWHSQRYADAAQHMRLAAELPGSPVYLPLLSSRLYAHAGDPETGLMLISAQLKQVESPTERERLGKRYAELWIDRDLASIDAAIDAYRELRGEPPASIESLLEAELLERTPRDPRGDPYRIVDGQAVCDIPYERLEIKRSYTPRSPSRRPGAPTTPAPNTDSADAGRGHAEEGAR